MKKTYETPVAEKIEFCYEDQIVASLGAGCSYQWSNVGEKMCDNWEQVPNN